MDIFDEYRKALKAGQKEYKESVAAKEYPYALVLDDIIPDILSLQQINVGTLEIPIELIVGTKTAGRHTSFSKSFLPLLDVETEFSMKWARLCDAHLSDTGITDPIRVFEYYGKFYVQEGNKRVSVMRYFGATTILAQVTRIMPVNNGSAQYQLYQEFLDFYQKAPLYFMQFTVPGSYKKLFFVLDMVDKEWSEDFIQRMRSSYARFVRTMQGVLKLKKLTKADAMLLFLQYHPFEDLHKMAPDALKKAIAALQPDVNMAEQPSPVALSADPTINNKKSFYEKLLSRSRMLRVAFIYERNPEVSRWAKGHDEGRKYLETVFPKRVETIVYTDAVPGFKTDALIAQAVEDGADVIFTTTPPLMGATLRCAAKYPNVVMMNCSVDMPYPNVRTYYGRVYEAKFITGAIAGAMARDGRIGYIGSYPIFGVPAGINAFALGARLVNPDVQIDLEWSCCTVDCFDIFRKKGISVVSNRDIPTPGNLDPTYGTLIMQPDGTYTSLASPVWHWGKLYEILIRSILDGSWDQEQNEYGKRAINYWWGMRSGVIDVQLNKSLPEGVAALARILRRQLRDGMLDPFARTIIDQNGIQRNDGSHVFSHEELLHMDWFVDFVHGSLPEFDTILPMAKNMVQHLGVYRDELQQRKDI
ncbi:MAG: BMP family ABC transporter substrate-binding protein [Oscillospiraceae bacterium]|nr:BMP family ABC transporter substrate-binding protein [Oscillospiraceae bacterium]